MPDLEELVLWIGSTVTGKRQGWDLTPEDGYDLTWQDEGLPAEIEGELIVQEFDLPEPYDGISFIAMINGQPVDTDTIVLPDEDDTEEVLAHLPGKHDQRVHGKGNRAAVEDMSRKDMLSELDGEHGYDGPTSYTKGRLGQIVMDQRAKTDATEGDAPDTDIEEFSSRTTLETGMESGVRSKRTLRGDPEDPGYEGVVEREYYNDGSIGIHKGGMDKREHDAEVHGAEVANAVGIDVAVVSSGVDDEGLYSIRAANVAGESGHRLNNGEMVMGNEAGIPGVTDTTDGVRIGTLDFLIDNPDRHGANFIKQDNDGRILPIDNGNARFAEFTQGDPMNGRAPTSPFSLDPGMGIKTNQYGEVTSFSSNALHPDDIPVLRGRLESLRPSFEANGNTGWHDNVMSRLDILEANASGTTRIF